ncbi:SET domain-containing protein-lysine N-methyltransferase [Aestuariispira insulae]|uniref:SET domain-containing protein-lysine N-methyltransferase n=1 Tax=Aestuariispira insulae TaxID=1461337 RepID=UPI0015F24FF4|nr:SET domain-containing protein-lysine N-methyltransferase [Aestuariispira insulae]
MWTDDQIPDLPGKLSHRIDGIEVRETGSQTKGRGLFAIRPIPAKTVLDLSPVHIIPPADYRIIRDLGCRHHIFAWDQHNGEEISAAIAYGILSFCNHGDQPNARIARDMAGCRMALISTCDIRADEEITIRYFNTRFRDEPN